MIKSKVFYFSRSFGNDHRWLYKIPEEEDFLNEIYQDYSATKIQIYHGYIKKKVGIYKKDEKIFIYKIEDTGRVDSGHAKYYCLLGFMIDEKQSKLFLDNLSFFIMVFYYLPNNCFPISDEIKEQTLEYEFNLDEIANQNLENDCKLQKFRLNLDSYLIQHPNWNSLIIIEEKENEYIIESKEDNELKNNGQTIKKIKLKNAKKLIRKNNN